MDVRRGKGRAKGRGKVGGRERRCDELKLTKVTGIGRDEKEKTGQT